MTDGDRILRNVLHMARENANAARAGGWGEYTDFTRGQFHGMTTTVRCHMPHDPLLALAVENELWFLREYGMRS